MVKNEYSHYLPDVVSEERLELYTEIEKCFTNVNYTFHIDNINAVFLNSEDQNSHKALLVNDIYRTHIDTVLGLQGVYLLNPYVDKLSTIVVILRTVCTLAVNKPSQIYSPAELSESESGCVTLANVVELITGFPAVNVLPLLDYVDSKVVEYLHNDIPTTAITNDTIRIATKRFKECEIEKTGMVVEGIRIFNRFGYSVDSFVKEFGQSLSQLDTASLAKEIVLLVLGSNTSVNKLIDQMLELADLLTETSLEATLTQNHIYRMVPDYVKK